MKPAHYFFCFFTLFASYTNALAQNNVLLPNKAIDKKLAPGEHHPYTVSLKTGEYFTATVMQKGVDVAIDVIDPQGKKLGTFDSPNGDQGPEPITIEAQSAGNYQLDIYNFVDPATANDSSSIASTQKSGDYTISAITILSAEANKQRLAQVQKDKDLFRQWLQQNAHDLKTVDAENGFEDLQPYKNILKNVQVVGLGESSHGTSEFFRMKHRMLEFLVKEMGYTAFYIEASRKRCEYINRYVLYGEGTLDTATAIQGFTTWRVYEVRSMIDWMRKYNATVPLSKRVKFLGYDIQINDVGQQQLNAFYKQVAPEKLPHLDSLWALLDSAARLSNSTLNPGSGQRPYQSAFNQSLEILQDISLNNGTYQYATGKEIYNQNLLNIKLIIEEIISYKDGYNGQRDYYMAQNILELLNLEPPGSKVVVWAHNIHIAKTLDDGISSMGGYLAQTLKQKYYTIGFEFYEGSFQSRNLDSNNRTPDWDIITIGAPPVESLAWYFNKAGKEKCYVDFKDASAVNIKNRSLAYPMHGFGSMYSSKRKETNLVSLAGFDGLIYIKHSTAAKKFTKVYAR